MVLPLGGIGAGAVFFGSDGWFRGWRDAGEPPEQLRAAPACFCAVWTRVGSVTEARALRAAAPLAADATLSTEALYPEVSLSSESEVHTASVTLRVFAPIVPADLRSSTLPAIGLIFHVKNLQRVPVEVSAAVSWQDLVAEARHAARPPGTPEVIAASGVEGGFGVQFESAGGAGMTLLGAPPRREADVTWTGSSSSAATPKWWDRFAHDGVVSDLPSARGDIEGDAAVVAIRVTLRPDESIELPFAVGWSAGKSTSGSGGRYYQRLLADSGAAARALLSNWRSLEALTEEWQHAFLSSSLPPALAQLLINSAAALSASTVLTYDGGFRLVDSQSPTGSETAAHSNLAASTLLISLYPELTRRRLVQEAGAGTPPVPASSPGGANVSKSAARYNPPQAAPTVARLSSTAAQSGGDARQAQADAETYLIECGQYVAWTGDLSLLRDHYPAIHSAIGSLARAIATSQPTRREDALRAAERLARLSGNSADTDACESALRRAGDSAAAGGDKDGDVADWIAREIGLRRPLDAARVSRVLQSARTAVESPDSTIHVENWNLLYLIEGFALDLEAGSLRIEPQMVGAWKELSAPLFAPTFRGSITFKRQPGGWLLTLHVDRLIALSDPGSGRPVRLSPSLMLQSIRLPGREPGRRISGDAVPLVHATIGLETVGQRAAYAPDGELVVTFSSPVTLEAGDRLEIDLHE